MWQHRKGIWVNDQNGDLLFPWEYKLDWDASRNKGTIFSSEHNVKFQFNCDARLANRLHDKANVEFDYQLAENHSITLVNSGFPGGDEFKVHRGNLTNGVTTLFLPYVEIGEMDAKAHIRINGNIVDIRTDDVSFKKLMRLREALTLLLSTISVQKPVSVGSEPAYILRILAWFYFIGAALVAVVFLTFSPLNNLFGIYIGIALLVSAFFGLIVCYLFAAISDNIRILADKALTEKS